MKDGILLKKSIYSAFIFFGTLILLSAGYAAYTWDATGQASIRNKTSGDMLTSSGWNTLVNNVDYLKDTTDSLGVQLSSLSGTVSNMGSTYANAVGYTAQSITLTATGQNIATVMTLPSAGTYLVWINARTDLGASSYTHFYLSDTTSCSTMPLGLNYMTNPSSTLPFTTTYSSMGILATNGSKTIYTCGAAGTGTLLYFGLGQSTAGYLKLK